MARTSVGLIPEGLEPLFEKAIRSGNRYIYVCYRRVLRFFNRARELELLARSYLVEISKLWFGLTEGQRQAWRDVSPFVGSNGWQLFVSDTSERINLDLSGVAIPSGYHQVRVGYLAIDSPASSIKIQQIHPPAYYIKRKKTGTQSQFQPVIINESFALPLVLGLNYKTDLSDVSGNPSARFYARVKSLYQGRNIYTDLEINFELSTGWKYQEVELTSVLGRPTSYSLYIELGGVTGEVWFDNPVVVHSGQNWIRDPYCDEIEAVFVGAFSQCLPNWSSVDVPAGSEYMSLYVDS